MGLMLSVLVFCVGVAEFLDCWHNFLLHLVQPQYNPLPRHFDLKSDYLSDREFQHPASESRRTSNVDICWPKDLSPDEVHVVKKRTHGDADFESAQRDRKILHHKKNTAFEGLAPDIVVHSSELPEHLESPKISRETSPNKLELGVIVESDSSSEVDEPSQIENQNYKKGNKDEAIEQEEELSVLCREASLPISESTRPRCPSAKILEKYDNESIHRESNPESFQESEVPASPTLPVFTDTILSQDVKRVDVLYPKSTDIIKEVSSTCAVTDNGISKTEIYEDQNQIKSSSQTQNTAPLSDDIVQPISSILDEGLEPIPEFPEIKIHESSPVLKGDDDSDSSINTSDASWMVRSKTSDRPLIIRFDMPPEKVEKDFQSVIETDLRALGEKEVQSDEGSSRPLMKTDSVDEYYDAETNQNGECSRTQNHNEVCLENDSNQVEEFDNVEADIKPASVNFMQIDSNSSSSSLSGIPPLPEDASDTNTQMSLPTDNCFSTNNDSLSLETSYLPPDSQGLFLACNSDGDKQEDRFIPAQKMSTDFVVLEKRSDDHSVKDVNTRGVTNISSETKGTVTKEIVLENECEKQDKNIITLKNNGKDVPGETVESLDIASRLGKHEVTALESGISQIKNIDASPLTVPESEVDKPVLFSFENNNSNSNSKESTTKADHADSEIVRDNIKDKLNDNLANTQLIVESKSVPKPSTEGNDKPNIPLYSHEKHPSIEEATKNTLNLPNENSSQKQLSKSSSKDSSTESSDTIELCRAKETDEEKREDNKVVSTSVKTKPSTDSKTSKTETPVKAGPSKPAEEAKPSTSNKEEDKAFWLIFSGEYTKAMNKDWHSGHFCCWQCDESLTGQRYVLRDEHPYCVKCYESVFANGCEECNKVIGIDSKDLSYKDKHWHEACFLCNKCRVSLVDKQFGSKLDKIFCGNCYDQQFASRCDGCGQIFKAGTKKMEYKTRQWHEPCFACCVCKSPIGTKSFIPREQEIYCATCYEEKFATRCVKCNKIITSGGVTYKNEPWHRECFTCTHCNASLAGQRFTSRDEKPYCADCFGELFAKRCTACSKPITGIGGTRFISFEDRHWHNDCFICASCKTSLVGRGFITDGDDIICPECAKQKLM